MFRSGLRWLRSSPSPEQDERGARLLLAEQPPAAAQQPARAEIAAGAAVSGTALRVRANRPANPFRRWGPLSKGLRIQVDRSRPLAQPWASTSVIPVSPGRHVVTCYFYIQFFMHGGEASTAVDVPAGRIVDLEYTPLDWGISAGTLVAHHESGRSSPPDKLPSQG
jgi:hypothetical protein